MTMFPINLTLEPHRSQNEKRNATLCTCRIIVGKFKNSVHVLSRKLAKLLTDLVFGLTYYHINLYN